MQAVEDTLAPPSATPDEALAARFQYELLCAKMERRAHEREYYLNFAFYLNYHYVTWDTRNVNYFFVPAMPYEIRVTINYFRNYIRTIAAKVAPPDEVEWIVEALSGDKTKRVNAVGGPILDGWYSNKSLGIKRKFALAHKFAVMMPVLAQVRPFIRESNQISDVTPQPDIETPTVGESPMSVPQSSPPEPPVELNEWECDLDLILPFDWFAIPGARTSIFEDWRGVFVRKRLTKEQVLERFGASIFAQLNEATTTEDDPLIMLALRGGQMGERIQSTGQYVIWERWEKPSLTLPKGRYSLLSTGGKLLKDQPFLPDDADELPFAMYSEEDGIGAYAIETCRMLRSIQVQYNSNYNRILTHIRYYSYPFLYIPMNSLAPGLLSRDEIDTTPGQIWRGGPNAQAEPRFILPSPLNPDLFQVNEYLLHDFENTGGLSQLSLRGMLPSRTRTLGQTEIISEGDSTRMDLIRNSMEESDAKVGELYLMFARKKFGVPRNIRMLGPSKAPYIQEWSSEDLDDDVSVRVKLGSKIGYSKQTRIQMAQILAQMFATKPTPEQMKVLNHVLELGLDFPVDPDEKQEALIAEENRLMIAGEAIQTNPGVDNVPLHVIGHQSAIIDTLLDETMPPDKQMLALKNLRAHLMETDAELMKLQASMQPPPDQTNGNQPNQPPKGGNKNASRPKS